MVGRFSVKPDPPQMALVAAQQADQEEVHDMANLDLSLAGQRLVEVPQHVLSRKFLHFLDLSGNSLTELPDALCNLTSLYVHIISPLLSHLAQSTAECIVQSADATA
jgi:hypothetical protein